MYLFIIVISSKYLIFTLIWFRSHISAEKKTSQSISYNFHCLRLVCGQYISRMHMYSKLVTIQMNPSEFQFSHVSNEP